MKTKKKILLAALLFAIVSAYLTYQFLDGLKQPESGMEKITVPVAKNSIGPGQEIKSGDIENMQVMEESYIPDVALLDASEIVGNIAKDRILKGEVFAKDRLVGKNENELAFMVPKGKRAISVNVDEFSGVADLIRPNDCVDIYVTAYEKTIDTATHKLYMPETSILLLQNIRVLSISKEIVRTEGDGRNEVPKNYSVTLAVEAEEGEKLVLGEEMGSIKLALRPFGDDSIHYTPGVIRDDLVTDKGKIIIPK